MKALTVCQPWAWAIVAGTKTIENRSWGTPYRGPLLIHAGASHKRVRPGLDELTMLLGEPPAEEDLAFGAIVGLATLVDCVGPQTAPYDPRVWRLEENPFADSDQWHWVLANRLMFREPLPCRGTLGLWGPPAGLMCSFGAGNYPSPASAEAIRTATPAKPACRWCGCTDSEGCEWVEPDLCSVCRDALAHTTPLRSAR